MKKKIIFLIFILFILFIPFISYAKLLISEVMYNPKGNDVEREWIEVVNLGPDIEIKTGKNGWRLFDGKKNRILKDENFVLRKNEIVLFVKNKNSFLHEYPNCSNIKVVESSFSLNNKEGVIKIIDENKNILAEFHYNKNLGGNGNGFSLINENGYIKEGNIEKGTPGVFPEPIKEIEENKKQSIEKIEENKNHMIQSESSSKEIATTSFDEKDEERQNLNKSSKKIYLMINEFFPNPKGKDEDEFIEIYNPLNDIQNLENLILKVGDRKFKMKGVINPKEYKVLDKKEIGFSIRNKGEEISLLDENDSEIFYIKYQGNAPENKSFSRDDNGKWAWTIPTPGKANIFFEEDDLKKEEVKFSDKNIVNENLENSKKEINKFSTSLRSNIFKNINTNFLFLGILISLFLAGILVLLLK